MARARGANALQDIMFESSYGTKPSGNWKRRPFVSSQLGSERGLIESDLLGQGREPLDPTQDVINNVGDHVVPVDVRGFGEWLKLMMGVPSTTEDTGVYTHAFVSGAAALPSASIQIGMPEIPRYFVHTGVKGNTMQIALSRRGLLNATLGLIAQNETSYSSTQAGTATEVTIDRFAQATGSVGYEGSPLGNVVSASMTYSNGLDVVETIRSDSLIEGADEGMATASGEVAMRFASMTMLDKATSGVPVALTFGWTKGAHSLLFSLPRVFLPKPKTPISGPNGIMATFNWQASGQAVTLMTATLVNDVASYG